MHLDELLEALLDAKNVYNRLFQGDQKFHIYLCLLH